MGQVPRHTSFNESSVWDVDHHKIPSDNQVSKPVVNQLIECYNAFISLPRFSMEEIVTFCSELCQLRMLLSSQSCLPGEIDVFWKRSKCHPERSRSSVFGCLGMWYFVLTGEDEPPESVGDEEAEYFHDKRRRLRTKSTLSSSKAHLKLKRQHDQLMTQRLHNIHAMDFEKYGLYGIDENVRHQLRRAFLSRTLSNSACQHWQLTHKKGILLHGVPGMIPTLSITPF